MSLVIGDNFQFLGSKPLDSRLTFSTLAAMVAMADSTLYNGITAYCVGEDKNYQWKSTNTTDPTLGKWRELEAGGDSALWGYLYNNAFYVESTHTTVIPAQTDMIYVERESKKLYEYDGTDYVELSAGIDTVVYQPGGSVAFASLPAGSASNLGFIYNITDAFTTTSDFVEGAGIEYPANTDVAVINAGTAQSPSYKYNVFMGSLAGYQKKIQYTAMPTADASHVGQILQYMGVTNSSYTHGYFYECTTDGTTYSWDEVDVQEGGGAHTIENNGTAVADRAALNFTDFDITDDDTDDETDIKAHRLTSAEMSEIMSTLPGAPTSLPVMFDEGENEYQVGWYRYANGTKKPVYEKMVQFTTLYTGVHQYSHGISNVERIWVNSSKSWGYDEQLSASWILGSDNGSGNGVKSIWTSSTVTNIWIDSYLAGSGRLTGLNVMFRYTKTTDQPA